MIKTILFILAAIFFGLNAFLRGSRFTSQSGFQPLLTGSTT
jgi:hypothetical protein